MADFQSTTYQAQSTAAENAGKIIADAALISGKGHYTQFEATVEAGTAAADRIFLGFLPAGLTVVPGSIITCSGAGGNTIDIGFEGETEALASNVPTAAGIALINPASPNYKNGSRRAVIATLDGSLAAGTVITVNLCSVKAE